MEPISRRGALRLAGGAAGASGVAGVSLMGGGGLLDPASAAGGRKIKATLNQASFRPGEVMRLRVTELLRPGRKIQVVDSTGLRWKRIARSGNRQVWTATAQRNGVGTVAVRVLWPNGRAVGSRHYRDRVTYRVAGPTTMATGAALIGMSAPSGEWDQRVREVGAGIAARRIFADLASGATSQIKLVEAAHRAGMLPIISYKVGGDIAGAVSGRYNAVAEQAATRLASYGLPTAVTFWHEPNPDVSPADYAAASRQLLPIFRRGELRTGPILNGWLLDRSRTCRLLLAP